MLEIGIFECSLHNSVIALSIIRLTVHRHERPKSRTKLYKRMSASIPSANGTFFRLLLVITNCVDIFFVTTRITRPTKLFKKNVECHGHPTRA